MPSKPDDPGVYITLFDKKDWKPHGESAASCISVGSNLQFLYVHE